MLVVPVLVVTQFVVTQFVVASGPPVGSATTR